MAAARQQRWGGMQAGRGGERGRSRAGTGAGWGDQASDSRRRSQSEGGSRLCSQPRASLHQSTLPWPMVRVAWYFVGGLVLSSSREVAGEDELRRCKKGRDELMKRKRRSMRRDQPIRIAGKFGILTLVQLCSIPVEFLIDYRMHD